MKYPCGQAIQLNDLVLIKDHQVEANVVRIIATQQDMMEVQLKEQGLFLSSQTMGLIFWPLKQVQGSLKLLSRGVTVKPFLQLDTNP